MSWPNFSTASVFSPISTLGEMLGAEALAGAHDGGDRLLRRDGAIDHLGAVAAKIAIAAGLRRLAEIGEQGLAPAARRLAQRHQRVEPLAVDALLLVGGVAFVDLQAAQPDVAHAVERQRIGRQAVAAGAADLLVIALDVGRHVGVETKRTSGLSMPMPNATVATMTTPSSCRNVSWLRERCSRLHAGVIGERLDAARRAGTRRAPRSCAARRNRRCRFGLSAR